MTVCTRQQRANRLFDELPDVRRASRADEQRVSWGHHALYFLNSQLLVSSLTFDPGKRLYCVWERKYWPTNPQGNYFANFYIYFSLSCIVTRRRRLVPPRWPPPGGVYVVFQSALWAVVTTLAVVISVDVSSAPVLITTFTRGSAYGYPRGKLRGLLTLVCTRSDQTAVEILQ